MHDAAGKAWQSEKIGKLQRRVEGLRQLNDALPPASILKAMNDRALIEMEGKLFRLKSSAPSAALGRQGGGWSARQSGSRRR